MYREKIQNLEQQLAKRYYEEQAADSQLRVGNKLNSEGDANPAELSFSRNAVHPRDEQSSRILSPLNFSRLAIGGDMSQESAEDDQEKSVVLLDSFVNSHRSRDSYNQRDSHDSKDSNVSLRYTMEGSDRLSAMLRDSEERDR